MVGLLYEETYISDVEVKIPMESFILLGLSIVPFLNALLATFLLCGYIILRVKRICTTVYFVRTE